MRPRVQEFAELSDTFICRGKHNRSIQPTPVSSGHIFPPNESHPRLLLPGFFPHCKARTGPISPTCEGPRNTLIVALSDRSKLNSNSTSHRNLTRIPFKNSNGITKSTLCFIDFFLTPSIFAMFMYTLLLTFVHDLQTTPYCEHAHDRVHRRSTLAAVSQDFHHCDFPNLFFVIVHLVLLALPIFSIQVL